MSSTPPAQPVVPMLPSYQPCALCAPNLPPTPSPLPHQTLPILCLVTGQIPLVWTQNVRARGAQRATVVAAVRTEVTWAFLAQWLVVSVSAFQSGTCLTGQDPGPQKPWRLPPEALGAGVVEGQRSTQRNQVRTLQQSTVRSRAQPCLSPATPLGSGASQGTATRNGASCWPRRVGSWSHSE